MTAFIAKRWDVANELAALWEATKDLPRGSIVEHATIEALTEKKKDKAPWQQIIGKWKRKMLSERGIGIAAVHGVGYRLLSVKDQQVKVADAFDKSGDRKKKHAMALVSLIPVAELDEAGLRYSHSRAAQIAAQLQSSKTDRAKSQSWLASPETLPRIAGNGK